MVDNIKFNKLNTSYNRSVQGNKRSRTAPTEHADISQPIDNIIKTILNEPPPAEDTQKIIELKEKYARGEYKVDYEKVSEELVSEYFAWRKQQKVTQDG